MIVQQAKKTPACYCMSPEAAKTVKVGAAAAQPWSLRQEATLYAGASFDTFTEMCHEACLGSHFVWFVTPYMAPLQQHSAPTGSTVLYLSSSVKQKENFVQFCTNFPFWLHFCTKLFFCARNCTVLHVLCTEGSMHHSVHGIANFM